MTAYSVEIKHFFVFVRRRRRLEGDPLQVRHKQDWGRNFILLLPQAAVLLGSNAGSDVVKQLTNIFHPKTSDLVLHLVPDVWGKLLECGLSFVQRRRTCNLVRERLHLCMDKWNCPTSVCRRLSFGKTHLNRPGTGPGYENTEPESILTVLRVPFIVCPLRREDAKSGKVV